MKTTVEFLNAVKIRHNLPSDGRLAAMLGHTRSSVSLLMQGRNFLGDEAALRVADLLDIDPAYVVACVHAEREKNLAVKKLWERIATLAAGVTALLVVAALPLDHANGFMLAGLTSPGGTLYIMSNELAGYWPLFLLLFVLMLVAFPRHTAPPEK